MKTITSILATLALTFTAHADCVSNARSKTSFTVVDGSTIILTGGIGPDIRIQTWAMGIFSTSSIRVLKDHFCSFAEGVLMIDGKVVDAREVKKIEPKK